MTLGPLVMCVLSFWQNGWQVQNLHDNPLIGAGAPALRNLGSKATDKIVQPKNQWWRFLSSAFIPSGATCQVASTPVALALSSLIHCVQAGMLVLPCVPGLTTNEMAAKCLGAAADAGCHVAGVLTLFAVVESLWTFALHLDPVLLGPSVLTIPFIYLISAIVGGLGSANLAPSLDACGASAGVCGLLGAWAWQKPVHACHHALCAARLAACTFVYNAQDCCHLL